MSTWSIFSQKVKRTLASLDRKGCHTPFFRGQQDSSWTLLPSIARYEWAVESDDPDFNPEANLYFEFVTEAGALLLEDNSSWANIFTMQHHGLPTRFLDWSQTFSVALYFAIKNADEEAAVWILDPFALNRLTINRQETIHPTDLGHNYEEYFVKRNAKLEGDVVAITPLRHNPRVFHQRAGFTLHDNIETPLEDLHPSVVTKITLREDGFEQANNFLELGGISEFTLFPDLDGLSRELKTRFFMTD